MARSPVRLFLLPTLVVVAAATVAFTYAPALDARAITFDDDEYLLENHLVQNPSWNSTRRFLVEVFEPSTVHGYYQPLTMISLMLDYALGGRANHLKPFHRTSLALHVVNTVLVVVFLYQLFGHLWAAAMAGLVFGVHPLGIESNPWVAERKTLLAAFFALSSLVFYVRFARSRGWAAYGASLLTFLLSLLSKPSATPLPVLLLLLDFWPLRRLGRRALWEKLPFFLVAAVGGYVTLVSQHQTYGTTPLYRESPLGALLVVAHNIVFYLQKLAWPGELSWYYPYPQPFTLAHPAVLKGVVGTILLLAALLISLRWTRALATSWLFLFVALLPAIGLISFFGLIAADRFIYLPSVGLLIALAWILSKASSSGTSFPNRLGGLVFAAVGFWTAALAFSTHRQLGFWKDSESLSRRMTTLVPDASVPRVGLGNALLAAGRLDEALNEYQEAVRLDPRNYNAHTVLGAALTQAGRTDEAIRAYTEALRLEPNDPRALNNLGGALTRRGRHDEAIEHFREALRAWPNYPLGKLNLSNALLATGKREEALQYAQDAVRLTPGDPRAENQLGTVLLAMGQASEAAIHFQTALQLDAAYVPARANLAEALLALGKKEEAVQQLREALRLQPNDADLHNRAAGALMQAGRTAEAAAHWTQAAKLRPNDPSALVNLANASMTQGRLDDAIEQYRQALSVDPNSVLANTNLAHALVAKGDWDAAVGYFQTAARLTPEDPELAYLLGITLQQQGKVEEAIVHYEQAVRLRPEFAEAHNNLGAALADLGRLEEAIAHFRKALGVDQRLAAAHVNLADALARQGKTQEATKHFQEALGIEPENAEVHLRFGEFLEAQGRPAEAQAEFREAARLDPENTEAQQKAHPAVP